MPVTISAPGYPLELLTADTMNVCYGGNQAIAIGIAAGGTPGYSYSWYGFGSSTSLSNNDTAFGLSAGTYTLEVEDANGCDTTTTVNIIEPLSPLGASQQVFAVACKGDNTGMIVAEASGGFGPVSYTHLTLPTIYSV